MIIVQVNYTVEEAYVNTNKARIEAFLKDFKKLEKSDFLYSIFQSQDGQTFTHLSQYKNKAIQETLLSTPSFVQFQEERDQHLTAAPRIEFLNFTGASKEVV